MLVDTESDEEGAKLSDGNPPARSAVVDPKSPTRSSVFEGFSPPEQDDKPKISVIERIKEKNRIEAEAKRKTAAVHPVSPKPKPNPPQANEASLASPFTQVSFGKSRSHELRRHIQIYRCWSLTRRSALFLAPRHVVTEVLLQQSP